MFSRRFLPKVCRKAVLKQNFVEQKVSFHGKLVVCSNEFIYDSELMKLS